MDSNLYNMIFKRVSFHNFNGTGNEKITDEEIENIKAAWNNFTPLYDDIKTCIKIVKGEETSCKAGEEYCVLIYSEKKNGYLQNVGYIGEQLDLYLAKNNTGSCWYGLGKTEEKNLNDMEFVIMFAIRKVSDESKYRKNLEKIKRKSQEDIWKGESIKGVTDIVRLAPSAVNTQPWIVENDGTLNVYRNKKNGLIGLISAKVSSYFNIIDIGIFLCYLELSLQHEGIKYTRELFDDEEKDKNLLLNARYKILS
ncbi:MAG: nitroreductase [Lachnospiraceae bacterium]|nr:nitroreductase [Lachnospiraceae bacterium]